MANYLIATTDPQDAGLLAEMASENRAIESANEARKEQRPLYTPETFLQALVDFQVLDRLVAAKQADDTKDIQQALATAKPETILALRKVLEAETKAESAVEVSRVGG